MSRGIHTKPNNGMTVDWLTPPEIVKSLGVFDLDPCAHPEQFYRTARKMICLPDDGLSAEWSGRVWLNPPYGAALKDWIARLASHGDGIALVPARTEVESWFWPYVWEFSTSLLFIRGRLRFYLPDKSQKGNAGHGSVLIAYGDVNSSRLVNSGIRGAFCRTEYFRMTSCES